MAIRACRMPHTVPNRPTNGETEPTEPRNATPPSNEEFASSSWWEICMPIQSLTPTSEVVLVQAFTPLSAMARNREFLGRPSMPSLRFEAAQNFFSRSLEWLRTRCCSMNLVMKMYQVPADMMARTTMMKRETIEPVIQMWVRPYGVACSPAAMAAAALLLPAAGAAGAAGAAASAAGAAAAGALSWARAGATLATLRPETRTMAAATVR